MNYKTIEDEVYKFCEIYFKELADVAEDNAHFVDDHNLRIPKENYAILNKFLQKTLQNFKILDPTYSTKTLNKLALDLAQLNEFYIAIEKKSRDIKSIFEKKFIPKSPTLINFAKAILDFADLPDKTSDELIYIKKMKQDYIQLKKVYESIFEETFSDDKKHYLLTLKGAINSKSYYFDKLLWKEADESLTIVKHFSIRKLDEKLNSKDYILFTTALMRPYTDEYRYLQDCLKVFK